MKRIILAAALIAAIALTAAAEVTGTFTGRLTVAADASLRLNFNVNPAGTPSTLDSPDQNVYGLPLDVVYNQGDSLSVRVAQIGLTYNGRLVKGNKLEGIFRQGALTLPLALERGKRAATPAEAAPQTLINASRPQTPKAPFPYRVEEVMVSPEPGVTLQGSLTVPENFVAGKTPALLLISGSGLQTRDEEVAGHKPFAVLADQLARRGIATLRYDERSAGASTGDAANATTATFAADARAWLPLLRANGFGKTGVLGHSEGARIAYMLDDTDFIIGLGLPALRGDSVIVSQNEPVLRSSGTSPETTELYLQALRSLYDYVNAHGAAPADEAGYVMGLTADWPRTVETAQLAGNLMAVARQLNANPWLLYMAQDSPAADIAAWHKPALALYGSLDMQVIPRENAQAVGRLNPAVRVVTLPGLNHLMQPAKTGMPDEYALIETTIAPEVIEAIAAFVNEQ